MTKKYQNHSNMLLFRMSFNSRSICNKIVEMCDFLATNTTHILAASEAWLAPSVSNSLIYLPTFQPQFGKDRNKNGGLRGVRIYVSDQLPPVHSPNLETDRLELR